MYAWSHNQSEILVDSWQHAVESDCYFVLYSAFNCRGNYPKCRKYKPIFYFACRFYITFYFLINFTLIKKIHQIFQPFTKVEQQSIESRIVGGKDAAEGEAPYQCSLQLGKLGHLCGCAIVSAEYILTAAHCLNG